MRNIYKLSLLLLCSLILGACSKNLEEININPNNSEKVDPQYLMSNVLITMAYDYQKDAYSGEPASAGRYITMVRNEGNDRFSWGAVNWDGIYQKMSINYNLQQTAIALSADQYLAVSKILGAFGFSYLTDLYGDIPYTEALKLKDGLVHPKYDKQQDIYMDLLKQLREASDMLAGNTLPIDEKADAMFGGNKLQWRKFANSLRIRLLLRCSKNYPQAFTEMQQILDNKAQYPIFESNADNAAVKYLGQNPENSWPGSPAANDIGEFNKRKSSKEVVDFLLQRKDPRLAVMIAKVDSTGSTVDKNFYVGVPNAIEFPYDYNGGDDHISKLGELFKKPSDDKLKAILMSYPELCFILAEALQKGKITVSGETAASMYYKGIDASMSHYGVGNDAESTNYYDQPSVKYDGTLKQLIGQKWMSLFLRGPEGWFDHRRTGFPEFVTGPKSAQKHIPRRYIYPSSESSLNLTSYEEAVSRLGEDGLNALMWYLK